MAEKAATKPTAKPTKKPAAKKPAEKPEVRKYRDIPQVKYFMAQSPDQLQAMINIWIYEHTDRPANDIRYQTVDSIGVLIWTAQIIYIAKQEVDKDGNAIDKEDSGSKEKAPGKGGAKVTKVVPKQ